MTSRRSRAGKENSNLQPWLAGGILFLVLATGVAWWFWPRVPVIQRDNLKYVQQIRTAVSAENSEWVEGVARAIDKQKAEGALAESEVAAFQRIIDAARERDWPTAERLSISLEEGQLNRRRPPATLELPDHEHDFGSR